MRNFSTSNSGTSKHSKRRSIHTMRRGLSLIELIVMAGVTSMMLVMVTSWIHQTMKQSTRFRMEHREQMAISRLSKHFRKHVWLSNAADLSDPESVSLTNGLGDQFTYRFEDQQIQFVHQNASEANVAVDRFIVPTSSNVRFGTPDDSSVQLKLETLKLETSAGEGTKGSPGSKSKIYLSIEPTLARWLPGTTSSMREGAQ